MMDIMENFMDCNHALQDVPAHNEGSLISSKKHINNFPKLVSTSFREDLETIISHNNGSESLQILGISFFRY